MAYDRFQYDLEQFIPVVTQEVEFAEMSGITDDQAYEQVKTFFPILQLRIQQLQNTGIIADTNRIKQKEGAKEMCGQGHRFAYLLVNHKVRSLQEVLLRKHITAQVSLQMLKEIETALKKWGEDSKFPCRKIVKNRKG